MNPNIYLAELAKLLGFMSFWDRSAVLAEYAAKFENTDDPEALAEALGSPTRVAITLARDYVPSPPPEVAVSAQTEEPEETEAPDAAAAVAAAVEAAVAENAAETPAAKPKRVPKARRSAGGVVLSIVLGIVIALPITLIGLAIGVPFLLGGGAAVWAAVSAAIHVLPVLGLISDLLLILGGCLVVAAIGLLVAAFGLWLSLSLAGVWLEKVVFPLGRRLCRKKEVAE